MPEDHKEPPVHRDGAALDRRRFVKVGASSLGLAGLGACVFGFRYLSPNVLYEPSPIVSVGRPERYRVGSVTLDPHSLAGQAGQTLLAVRIRLSCETAR